MRTVQEQNIPGSTSGTTLGDLTEVAEEDGEDQAQELVDEMVDDGVDLLESAGINAREPIENDYVSTNSIQDQVINGWAGAMNSYSSELKIKGQEVSRSFKKMNKAMDSLLDGSDEAIGEEREDTSGPLEKNAFNTVVHELFHFNQDEDLIGAVDSEKYSAEDFYHNFTDEIFDKMHEDIGKFSDKKPSNLMEKVVDQEFKYAFGVILSSIDRDLRTELAEKLSNPYENWREAAEKSEDFVEKDNTYLDWIEAEHNPLNGLEVFGPLTYQNKYKSLAELTDQEEFEKCTEELRNHIENHKENYDPEQHYKSPEEAIKDIEDLEDNKKELLEINREKRKIEEEVREKITYLLDGSEIGEPVTKPFKEAFAHMTTLALQDDLTDPESRQNYLERVEESYNSDMTWGYGEDAGTVLRGIVNTVIEEEGEIEGSVEEQIGRIHELQSEYADQHRIEYS